MMTRSHRLAFLKVLAAAAWADGVVQAEERNRIKVLFNGFDLPPDDRREVEHLLEHPVGFDEAVEYTKEFAGALALPGDRQRLLDELESMLGDESRRAPEERKLLEHVRAILSSHTVVDGLAEKLRGLFSRTLFAREATKPESREQIDREFLEAMKDDSPGRGIELQRICADYCRDATMEDRLRVLDAMFRRAAEDHVITKREADHIYRVANLLWISGPEYHGIRDRYRDRIAT
jgi:uncharacterized tellurite resistance protein B-like protein